jgi:predicted KAP-like P-loop ATPase
VAEASEKLSEKAVSELLNTFQETVASTSAFQKKLAELAKASNGTLVVIIDELDRCRPDFALALLERVKHLFDVEGVAFLLFVHTPALNSAIANRYRTKRIAGFRRCTTNIPAPSPKVAKWCAVARITPGAIH